MKKIKGLSPEDVWIKIAENMANSSGRKLEEEYSLPEKVGVAAVWIFGFTIFLAVSYFCGQ
ncbi:hypothetical protein KAI54_01225 [Candidatus Gracilibacteria bacterium]|nr:hypothetical protein [Candidatus Gracilibacteria bacterium]